MGDRRMTIIGDMPLYPEVWTDDENTGICAVYTEKRMIRIPSGFEENIVLNGTKAERLFLEFEKECDYLLEVRDLYGGQCFKADNEGEKRNQRNICAYSCENLSAATPRTIHEIESLIGNHS